ncbi:polyphosphate kinase 2 family protein [Duganella sp. FT92W]|uniref:Polyphosphate kinase 2 family protein n=1 Tax=Pseudoduganella rivuli TaxID=2666085 RepID=A0A7X2LSB0_9BURK|nr:PPK2 family polyphosphate kinase [Pseudoduganella rivuli]MRV70757.1 polyphosphate kinase 2 family protein [Pseudoduganella rivuli]
MKAREQFRVPDKFTLDDADAARQPLGDGSKAGDKECTDDVLERINDLQTMLYAQRKHKVLLVLQGMDTSGKDGAVRSLYSKISPVGLRTAAFKAPTELEAGYDYLWRVHRHVPAKGEMVVFNRSHYEEVLITRVLKQIDGKECRRRYAQIRDFERMLAETGTTIVKVMLHISKSEQRERLQARIDNPKKQWKFDQSDIDQRKQWRAFQRAYEEAILATDADHAPWYIVPADSKPHRDLAIARLLLETLESLKLRWPAPDASLATLKIR